MRGQDGALSFDEAVGQVVQFVLLNYLEHEKKHLQATGALTSLKSVGIL